VYLNNDTNLHDIVRETLKSFYLDPDLHESLVAQVTAECARRSADFARCVTISCLLPLLQQNSTKYFCTKEVPRPEAEDLSGELGLKVLQSLFGGWPHGNAGAWFFQIRNNSFADYCKARDKERKRLGVRNDQSRLLTCVDPAEARAELERFIGELPVLEREILERLRNGQGWDQIGHEFGISPAEAKDAIQRIDWPGGLSRPTKRRSRRSS